MANKPARRYQQRTLHEEEEPTNRAGAETNLRPLTASVFDIESALRRWLAGNFEDEADWLGIIDDIRRDGLSAYPSLHDALPPCVSIVLRHAADAVYRDIKSAVATGSHIEPAQPDPRADRIAAIKIIFGQCVAAFTEYSELTGDFTGPTVPRLGIQAMQKKLTELASI